MQKYIEKLQEQNRALQQELMPFRHWYFKNLDTNAIAELAKKSIRFTTDHIKLNNLREKCLEYKSENESYIDIDYVLNIVGEE